MKQDSRRSTSITIPCLSKGKKCLPNSHDNWKPNSLNLVSVGLVIQEVKSGMRYYPWLVMNPVAPTSHRFTCAEEPGQVWPGLLLQLWYSENNHVQSTFWEEKKKKAKQGYWKPPRLASGRAVTHRALWLSDAVSTAGTRRGLSTREPCPSAAWWFSSGVERCLWPKQRSL